LLVVVGLLAGLVGLVLPVMTALPAAGADGALRVIGARLGTHPNMTRFVLEIAGHVTYQAALLGDPYRVVIDLPELAWPGSDATRAGLGAIRSYHLEQLRPGFTRLVLDTTGPVRILGTTVIAPAEGHQTRFVLDVEPVSAETFRQNQKPAYGHGSGAPPAEAAPKPAPQTAFLPPVRPPPARPAVVAAPPPPESAPHAPSESPPQTTRSALPASLSPAAAASAPPTPLVASATPAPAAQGPATQPPVALAPVALAPMTQTPVTVADTRPTPARPADPPDPRDDPPPSADEEPAAPPPAPAVQMAAMTPPAAPARSHRATPGGKPVIALDPGHGGVDPGAIGYNGIHEKDITLATAREVRRQLEATGRYRVMMTREEDEFIPLRERVARAREADAQLFISLHADSIVGSQVRGLSIYTLSDKASDHEAESLAAKENRSDAIGGVDLSHENDQVATILIDLAQRDTRNHSRHFAGLVLHEVGHIQKLLPKPDRSAGFAVLTAADVPSVLIEMGYLSSPEDARLLTEAEHRERLATSLVHAIDGYFGWLGTGRRS
jgi:N-acetylmuramoyl-L-alanine amidase